MKFCEEYEITVSPEEEPLYDNPKQGVVMYERKANCPSVVTLLWPVLEPEAHIN